MTKLLRSRTVAVAAGAGVLVGAGGIGAASAAGAHLPWNSVGTHQIRNGSVRSIDVHNGSLGMRDLNHYTENQIQGKADNGTLGANFTTNPTPVAHIGGKFSENATALGKFTLKPGTYVVNAEGLFESMSATTGSSQLQLALRSDSGEGFGTCFTGETSPTSGRDASCTSTKAVTVSDTTTVTVYAFGYQDDQSSKDSGSWMAVGRVNAIQVGG